MDHIKVCDSNDLVEVRNKLASPQTQQAENDNESDDYNLYFSNCSFEMVAQTFKLERRIGCSQQTHFCSSGLVTCVHVHRSVINDCEP